MLRKAFRGNYLLMTTMVSTINTATFSASTRASCESGSERDVTAEIQCPELLLTRMYAYTFTATSGNTTNTAKFIMALLFFFAIVSSA